MKNKQETVMTTANLTYVEYPAWSGRKFKKDSRVNKKDQDSLDGILQKIRNQVQQND